MTMVLAVGLGSSGCDLSGGREFETITDADISNAEEIDVSEEETLIVVETSEAVPETDESMEQEVSSDIIESSMDSEELKIPEMILISIVRKHALKRLIKGFRRTILSCCSMQKKYN